MGGIQRLGNKAGLEKSRQQAMEFAREAYIRNKDKTKDKQLYDAMVKAAGWK